MRGVIGMGVDREFRTGRASQDGHTCTLTKAWREAEDTGSYKGCVTRDADGAVLSVFSGTSDGPAVALAAKSLTQFLREEGVV